MKIQQYQPCGSNVFIRYLHLNEAIGPLSLPGPTGELILCKFPRTIGHHKLVFQLMPNNFQAIFFMNPN